MKKIYSILFTAVSIAMVSFVFSSCSKSDDSSDGGNTAPQKVLNKTTFSPKKWYSEGSAFVHDLRSGNQYGTEGGSWAWKNNSDTMIIVSKAGYPQTFWKVYWNTDKEMECEKVGTFTKLLYKDAAW